jgi:hypothetical protein
MSSSKIKKGMIFAGCSFTWGQGLYFYSKMLNLDYSNPNSFSKCKVTYAHNRYKDVLRFPRLVANHFETFEVVKQINGGCDDHSINFIDSVFDGQYNYKINYNEISHIIFQTSELTRNLFCFNYNNIEHKIFLDPKNETLYEWMIENEIDLSGVMNQLKEQVFLRIKELFIKYEEKGITCKILCWRDDFISLIKSDPFFSGKFINFEYKDKTYDCIDYLIKTNKGMDISTDIINLKKEIEDDHPSKQCHRLIADSIIKHLENDNI